MCHEKNSSGDSSFIVDSALSCGIECCEVGAGNACEGLSSMRLPVNRDYG